MSERSTQYDQGKTKAVKPLIKSIKQNEWCDFINEFNNMNMEEKGQNLDLRQVKCFENPDIISMQEMMQQQLQPPPH